MSRAIVEIQIGILADDPCRTSLFRPTKVTITSCSSMYFSYHQTEAIQVAAVSSVFDPRRKILSTIDPLFELLDCNDHILLRLPSPPITTVRKRHNSVTG